MGRTKPANPRRRIGTIAGVVAPTSARPLLSIGASGRVLAPSPSGFSQLAVPPAPPPPPTGQVSAALIQSPPHPAPQTRERAALEVVIEPAATEPPVGTPAEPDAEPAPSREDEEDEGADTEEKETAVTVESGWQATESPTSVCGRNDDVDAAAVGVSARVDAEEAVAQSPEEPAKAPTAEAPQPLLKENSVTKEATSVDTSEEVDRGTAQASDSGADAKSETAPMAASLVSTPVSASVSTLIPTVEDPPQEPHAPDGPLAEPKPSVPHQAAPTEAAAERKAEPSPPTGVQPTQPPEQPPPEQKPSETQKQKQKQKQSQGQGQGQQQPRGERVVTTTVADLERWQAQVTARVEAHFASTFGSYWDYLEHWECEAKRVGGCGCLVGADEQLKRISEFGCAHAKLLADAKEYVYSIETQLTAQFEQERVAIRAQAEAYVAQVKQENQRLWRTVGELRHEVTVLRAGRQRRTRLLVTDDHEEDEGENEAVNEGEEEQEEEDATSDSASPVQGTGKRKHWSTTDSRHKRRKDDDDSRDDRKTKKKTKQIHDDASTATDGRLTHRALAAGPFNTK